MVDKMVEESASRQNIDIFGSVILVLQMLYHISMLYGFACAWLNDIVTMLYILYTPLMVRPDGRT